MKYTSHLKVKMIVRGFPEELPEVVFGEAERKFHDEVAGHYVALKEAFYAGKRRLLWWLMILEMMWWK